MNVTGKTVQLGVLGCPVEHSISPQLHNAMIEKMNLDYIYSPFRVKEGDMEYALKGMKALNIRGFNVTIPHKQEAARLCDEIDPFAKKMGACNTLVNNNGVIKGYNTDGGGFIRALRRKGVDPKGKKIMLLGAGGAAAGVGMALAQEGAEIIYIVNRTREKAKDIAFRINKFYSGRAAVGEGQEICDILINTTSVGMNSDKCPVDDVDNVKSDGVVCDIVYCPRETALLKMAKKANLKTVGGIGMLINQAVIAFELFTKKDVPAETVDYLYNMTELDYSIVLTGFMGTGKSVIGKRLCALTGAEFIDTDSMIEEEAGMSISDIFASRGEEYFRDMESRIIKSLAGRKGAVISTGGGAVIRRENINALRDAGGVVFCLKADIERVYKNIGRNTASRPLLAGKTMEEAKELLEHRKEAYANCDFEIDVTTIQKEQSADEILKIYMDHVACLKVR